MKHFTQFRNTEQKPDFPALEEEILSYWKEIDAFKQQLERSKDRKPFSFFDGPPFATGMPHYGHICAGTIKDVITRYATMTGHHVPRRFGWDCHGLPVEFQIDKDFDIKTKAQREEFGLANYNRECRNIVMKYAGEWEEIVTRLGRWIDFKNDYKTLDLSFMESVWWVFKQIYDKGHVYRGCKIMPYSNGCNTVLSNFEAGLNYKDVFDPAVFITFPLVEDPEVSLIGWTTTPWTLPSNLACVVHPDFTYVKFKDLASGKVYIVAECRLKALYNIKEEKKGCKPKKNKKKKGKGKKKPDAGTAVETKEDAASGEKKLEDVVEVLETMKGTDLEKKEYTPLFEYMGERRKDGCFRVLCDTYVTDDSGTGVVHTAPGYGEDDYRVCMKYEIFKPDEPGVLVDDNGYFIEQASDYTGIYLKDADEKIVKDLKERGRMFKKGQIKHSYPFCWRSDTPLIYKAVDQWFVNVSKFKDRIVKINETEATWVPPAIQTGRFHNWLKDAQDWCISRDRFWGTPIPIWVSDDGEEVVVVGSIEELQELTGATDVTDLHRESIDSLTIPSKQGKGDLKRIPEVFDCWFESGSMPYASVGYPRKISQEDFDKIFPANFIGEGLDQTRGWFYTLNVLSTALFDKTPYKNLIVNGLVLAEDGSKMSKSKNNFDPPMQTVEKYGADAIRLYLMNSPLVKADPLKFKTKGVFDVVKNVFIPWYSVCRFLLQNITRWEEEHGETFAVDENITRDLGNLDNVMDRWIISATQNLTSFVRKELDNYRLYTVLEKKVQFLDQLSNWYLKLNRDRLKGENGRQDWTNALTTLHSVMMNSMLLMAPYVPFLVEAFYQDLRKVMKDGSPLKEDSIHYLLIPEAQPSLVDSKLLDVVDKMQRIVEKARLIRDNAKVSMKQGVKKLTVVCLDENTLEGMRLVENYIQGECNVLEVDFTSDFAKYMKYELKPNHRSLGALLGKEYGALRKGLMSLGQDAVEKFIKDNEVEYEGRTFAGEHFTLEAIAVEQADKLLKVQADLDFAVVLDLTVTEELVKARYAREFVNRVQKLRKDTGLNLKDNILITFAFEDPESDVAKGVVENLQTVQKTTRKKVLAYDPAVRYAVIAQKACEIEGQNVSILISGNILVPNTAALERDFGEKAGSLAALLGTVNADNKEASEKESTAFVLGEEALELKKGVHYDVLY